MSVLFFPQRIVLRIDGRKYSPALLENIVTTGGVSKSYSAAAKLLEILLDVKISSRQVNHLTSMIGEELRTVRDEQTDAWRNRSLTTSPTRIEPLPQLACVQTDGGRMQTRKVGCGSGVHDPHWREVKNAGFFRMATKSHAVDPHPELPSCYSSRKNMGDLLVGLGQSDDDFPNRSEPDCPKPDLSWRPKSLFRTCLASLCNSDSFGPMMAAEADRRGFFAAPRRAFLGDGLAYNWSIQKKHFPSFTPILDFIHAIERLHEVSKALDSDVDDAWQQTVDWMQECWQGEIENVIGILKTKQIAVGLPPANVDDKDSRKILAETITYLSNNVSRMHYPAYREAGLPMSSCLIESQVKEMNHRVKGTEKFWNDGFQGEAILQVRAALLCNDDRLKNHFQTRKGKYYARNT